MQNNAETPKQRLVAAAYWVGCFCAPIIVLAALSAWCGVYPFGPQSFLSEDMKYQYVDLFAWFREVLLGQTSIFYVANIGLGTNAWGLVSYYLSSPFNLILVLFDENHLTLFFWVIVALKLGSIQVSMAWYLRRRFGLSRSTAFLLALCFTWSSWVASQLRNPLWLDALILLPLMEYAVYRLIRDMRWLPLTVVYAIAVITCWYTAYMIAIFSCLFFVLEAVAVSAERKGLGFAHVVKCAVRFAGALLASLLFAAFTFVPMVFAMSGGTGGEGLEAVDFFLKDADVMVNSFFLGDWVYNITPQHYAGTLVALLLVAFFFVRDVPLRVKVAALILFAFMVASSAIAPLQCVWGGMRMPTGFYCRISFMTIFLMVWMAGYALKRMEESGKVVTPVVVATVVVAVLAMVILLLGWSVRARFALIEIGLAAVFGASLLFLLSGKGRPAASCVVVIALVGICVFGELLYNARIDWSQLYEGYEQEYHDSYVEEAHAQLDELRAYDDGLYRVEKTYTRAGRAALNEAMAHDYLGVSTYLSSQDRGAVNMLNELGYSTEGTFSTRYIAPILSSDSLLGVKYISSTSCPPGCIDVGLASVGALTGTAEKTFYMNPYALPLGYGVSDEAAGVALAVDQNPFERQNALMSALLGKDVELYKPMTVAAHTEAASQISATAIVPAHAIGYVYVSADEHFTSYGPSKSVWLSIDGKEPILENDRWHHAINALGGEKQDDTRHRVTVSTAAVGETDGNPLPDGTKLVFYYLDVSALEKAIEALAEHPVSFSAFESGHIVASYQAEEGRYAMITIPTTAGWKAQVNGRDVELASACESGLMLVPVEKGENDIRLDFMSPGFIPGVCVSAAALVLLVAYCLVRRRVKRGNHSMPR